MGELIDFPSGKRQAETGQVPPEIGQAGFYRRGDELVFGNPDDPRNALELVAEQQAKELKRAGADVDPLIVATRQAIDPNESWDELGKSMSSTLPVVDYVAMRSGETMGAALEQVQAWTGRDAPPTTRDELLETWRLIYELGVGTFHMDKLRAEFDPTLIQSRRGEADMHALVLNLSRHPAATLNCLNAARLHAHPQPIERTVLAQRPETVPRAEQDQFEEGALRILGSPHLKDRPYVSWYLLSQTAIWRRNDYLEPLLRTISDTDIGPTVLAGDVDTLGLLDEADQRVARVVGKDWDQFARLLPHFDRQDQDHRIIGAVQYGKTRFYQSSGASGRDDHDAARQVRPEIEEVQSIVAKLIAK